MIKFAVFDWDGTLADTYGVILEGYEYMFSKMRVPFIGKEEVKRLTSTLQNKDTFAFLFGKDALKAKGFYDEYMQKNHARIQAMPHAQELLDFCRNRGILCYLMTNKRRKYIIKELEVLGLKTYFEKVLAAGDLAEDKPHLTACRALFEGSIPPAEEILVIGDGRADLSVAACYGARSVIYDAEQNKQLKGTYVVSDLKDIINIILESKK